MVLANWEVLTCFSSVREFNYKKNKSLLASFTLEIHQIREYRQDIGQVESV